MSFIPSNKILIFAVFIIFGFSVFLLWNSSEKESIQTFLTDDGSGLNIDSGNQGGIDYDTHPLTIESLRNGEYPGSDIVIEHTLAAGSNYDRYISSYKSEGLKIFGLLTVPNGESPKEGWPAIIFNHGYINPSVYRTTEKYVEYQDAFARNGYVTFKSDYRGHGNSEGEARGGYGSNDYTIDVLNAVTSIQNYEGVNKQKIGMWGHSMGGHITLESMVVNQDIKAGSIWAGVVGSYEDIFERWSRRVHNRPSPSPGGRGWWRYEISQQFGEPAENPEFWEALSATSYLTDISGPIQLQHGSSDASVDVELSRLLDEKLKSAGKNVETFIYEGDNHNLSNNLSLALDRSVEFFDNVLK